ncbi:hypothetical protein K1719_017557 [Acacia pycnantha]|nr:hypothetical protein K1719_017557 [Acacia pycnantha]
MMASPNIGMNSAAAAALSSSSFSSCWSSSRASSSFTRHGINTYMDCDLERGNEISLTILKAIKQSKILLLVFSENYAESRWTMNELAKIMECKRTKGQHVIPIFYKVHPRDVRYQKGNYEISFKRHKKLLEANNSAVQQWETAMTEAANLSGWEISGSRNEAELVEEITNSIMRKLESMSRSPVIVRDIQIETEHQGANFASQNHSDDLNSGDSHNLTSQDCFPNKCLSNRSEADLVDEIENGIMRKLESMSQSLNIVGDIQIATEQQGANYASQNHSDDLNSGDSHDLTPKESFPNKCLSNGEAELVDEIANGVMRNLESMSRPPVIVGDIQIATELQGANFASQNHSHDLSSGDSHDHTPQESFPNKCLSNGSEAELLDVIATGVMRNLELMSRSPVILEDVQITTELQGANFASQNHSDDFNSGDSHDLTPQESFPNKCLSNR